MPSMISLPEPGVDERDFRPTAMARIIVLGNPNLTYNAEDWNKLPDGRKKFMERATDKINGATFDGIVKNIRERYKYLDELPTRYGIAFAAGEYLRQCSVKERRQLCAEFYFYIFDDRFMFMDVHRGLRDQPPAISEPGSRAAMERDVAAKGCGRLMKQVIQGFYRGTHSGHDNRTFEMEWKAKVYEKRSAERVLVDICGTSQAHGWRHADVIKLAHFPARHPWQHAGELFTLVAWAGERGARATISEEAPANFNPSEQLQSLLDLLQDIDDVKHAPDSQTVSKLLLKHHSLCRPIFPGIVPNNHFASPEVTAVFAAHSPIREILSFLSSWHVNGFFEAGQPHAERIASRLNNPATIREERLKPAEVFMAWKCYERSKQRFQGKRTRLAEGLRKLRIGDDDVKESGDAASGEQVSSRKRKRAAAADSFEPKPMILGALSSAFSESFQNFQPSKGKKFFIVVDAKSVISSDETIVGAKYLKPLEAAACLLTIAARKECNGVRVAIGSKPFSVKQSMTVDEITDEITAEIERNPGEFNLTEPLSRAHAKDSDVVIIITNRPPNDGVDWFKQACECANKIASARRSQLKVALCFLTRRREDVQPLPVVDNVLVVNGWNRFVPEVIWSFARGELDDFEIKLPPKPQQRD